MNQLVEKFCNFSLPQSCCEDMKFFISYVSSKYEENALKAISYVILGCLSLLIFVLLRRPKPKPSRRLQATRSFIVRELHSGYPALDRLMTEQYENPTALNSSFALKWELKQDLPDLPILQQKVAELERREEEDCAEKILRAALKKANEKKKPHEAYEFEMLIVEVLIYKGKKSSLESGLQCQCLADESLKDARRPLYKAIIHCLLGDMKKAEEHWDEFNVVREPAFGPQIDFDTFKEHVHRLKNATLKVAEKRRKTSQKAT
ncbi:hypothetical protein PHAVU_006G164900 [Phaseolus vulgaris]|uniref:Uncharacterized protein n=1 Tax=Phaseolus vulgaris TaxID=3885 RepID=V7BS80_PHAVU|nr:hypothetical protein PHAVU_006G164900g [Phaseolus vulgaris]ESW19900.1 hypothetical protein PHAVU_006G164900g [Phaseolus vulgaris]